MMVFSGNRLHIVAFDIPDPPSYGGVIDVFYKIKALSAIGVEIILHCWQYGNRKPSDDLGRYCKEVYYYPRNRFMSPFTGKIPFIVKTRHSSLLVQRINEDHCPILFEGLHTTAPLFFDELNNQKTFIRNHNIETDYYRNLATQERNFLRKQYFIREAKWLKSYQEVMAKCDSVFSISPNDQDVLSQKFRSYYVPAFHPNDTIAALPGKGAYCFYHGNLSVAENDEAAQYLVNQVFLNLEIPLIIGGNKGSAKLKSMVEKVPNVELREGLSIAEFDTLMMEASINVLPTFQSTGIKLKLLNALYKGRHCVVNNPMISNTGLEGLCHVANTPEEFRTTIKNLFGKSFDKADIDYRKAILTESFDNQQSALKLASFLFNT